MARIVPLSVVTALLLMSSVGCTSPLQALIRGQSPPAPHAAGEVRYAEAPAGAVMYGSPMAGSEADCPDGKCKEYTGGWHWLFGLKGKPRGQSCRQRGTCRPQETGHGKAHGYHIHNWTYTPPRGLVYPPANQPAGVWFYPYYTLKGPDDFFYTGK